MKELKIKLKKAKKIKFLRNIMVGVIGLIIALFIVNYAPGYKRDKFKDKVNIVLDEENITENLKHDIYVNENGTVYISEEDVRSIFDKNIYYDQKYNQFITTSDTKVANIVIDKKEMIVNGSNQKMLDAVIKINDEIYLPIYDMTIVYKISVQYIPSTNRVIIDNLDKGIIRTLVSEQTDIRFRPRKLSKVIGELKEGESVFAFYTTSKGWRKIRTSSGIIGYIKANKLTSEYILRQDMEEREDATIISKEQFNSKNLKVDNKNIIIQNYNEIQKNEDEENTNKIWVTVTNASMETPINIIIKDYKTRTELIDIIVSKTIENGINGIVIDFNNIQDNNDFIRFIIELAPKLREIGVSTGIVENNGIKIDDYKDLVEYIVE